MSFSYADTNIQGIYLNVPEQNLNPTELISYLETETQLVFENISALAFAIRPRLFSDITKTQYLDEVILTNYLTPGISLQADGTAHVNLNTFGILPGLIEPDVLQAIQALPGITSAEERISNVTIRGGTHDQNLILWDGVKMYQSGHFFGLISAFNPALISEVVVSKNGSSAQFGDGVSGIINMKSAKNISNKPEAGFGVNMLAANAYALIPVSKKIGLQVSGRRSLTDAFETPTYKQYFQRIFQDSDLTNPTETVITNKERFHFYDLSGKLQYAISGNDKLELGFVTIVNFLDYEELASVNQQQTASNSKLNQNSFALQGSYTKNWHDKLKTHIQASFSQYNLYAKQLELTNSQSLIQENTVADGSFKAHLIYNVAPQLNYEGGYQYSEIGISNLEDVSTPIFRRYIKEVLRTHGFYNEFSYKSLTGNTRARFGFRVNYIEKFSGFYFEPRISFNQIIATDFRLELLGELKSQTTSQIIDLQNDFLGIEKKRWILANNKDIPVITSGQLSAGLHFNKHKWLISLEGYIKHVDGITTRSQGFQNQFQYTNAIGRYFISGLDVLVSKTHQNLHTWLGYSYSKNDYTFPQLNNGEPFPNNLDIRHQLNLSGTYSLNNFQLALGVNWHTGKPAVAINTVATQSTNILTYTAPNTYRLPDYWRTDFSVTYDFDLFKTSKAHVGASVWNIFNTSNTINAYYIQDNNGQVIQVKNNALNITPNVTFGVRF
ncbi:TonB-dependent receptor plug domain-containing protein [Bizionia sediminis]